MTARAPYPGGVPNVFPPPPVSRWGLAWRLAVVVTLSAALWIDLAPLQLSTSPTWFGLDLTSGLAAVTLCVFYRRKHALAVALITAALSAFSATAAGPATWALFSLATRRRWREVVPAGLANVLAVLIIAELTDPMTRSEQAVFATIVMIIVAVVIGWGMYVGSRRELLSTLRERAETTEREQAVRLERTRIAERNRIAREMHDVLAHRISMVAMHAGALDYREDLTREQVRESAAIIHSHAHQALTDLRTVLGILRDDLGAAGEATAPPQPAATDVVALVEEARIGGARVDFDLDLDLAAVPEVAGRTLYRVIQEALTNARKHAPMTRVTVQLQGDPTDGIRLEASNPVPVGSERAGPALPSSGLGLVGVAERVELAGGTVAHRAGPEGFRLTAWLPWAP